MKRPLGIGLLCGLLVLSSCRKENKGAPSTEAELNKREGPSKAPDPIVHIPVGSFAAGSLPLERGRRPNLEPILQTVELGPYRIDRDLSRENPGEAPSQLTWEAATILCERKGARLCTDLEWERACKGPNSQTYPGGKPCQPPGTCTSSFELENMTLHPEWTLGSVPGEDGTVTLHGSEPSASPEERRCAARFSETKTKEKSGPVTATLRCCYGATNAKTLAIPKSGPLFREVDLEASQLASILASDEHTKELSRDLTFFKHPDGAATVIDRGDRNLMGFTLTTRPLEWQPERGVRVLVVAGRSGEKTSFVVAIHRTPDRDIVAGSFVMKGETGPVALAYANSISPRVHFSTSWGTPGETGKVLFRPPEELVFLQP